jgi:hypothetical protein
MKREAPNMPTLPQLSKPCLAVPDRAAPHLAAPYQTLPLPPIWCHWH